MNFLKMKWSDTSDKSKFVEFALEKKSFDISNLKLLLQGLHRSPLQLIDQLHGIWKSRGI